MSRTLLWHPKSGPPLLLTDPANGLKVSWHLTGFMATTYRVTTRRYPGQPGSRLQAVTADERQLEVGLSLRRARRPEFVQLARHVVRQLRNGPGRLEVVEDDLSSRWVDCVYSEGLEGAELAGSGDDDWWQPIVSFVAPQPYAKSAPITVSWSLTGDGRGWFPIVPIRLSASGIAGRKRIYNPGDVETFPLVQVQGPGEQLVVRHRGTGRAAHLDYVIPESGPASMITIDTRAGAQSIVDGYGTNLFEHLTDDDPSLWSLLPGYNDVEVQLQQTGPGARVSMTFDPLCESL